MKNSIDTIGSDQELNSKENFQCKFPLTNTFAISRFFPYAGSTKSPDKTPTTELLSMYQDKKKPYNLSCRHRAGVVVQLYSFFNLSPGRFTRGNYLVPGVKEAGLTAGPFWTGTENHSPTGIRSPDRPAIPAHALVQLIIGSTAVLV